MVPALRNLISRLLKSSLEKAQDRYKTTPDSASAVKLSRLLSWSGRASDAYYLIVKARRSFPADEGIRNAYGVIRNRYAKTLLARTLRSLKHDAKVESYIRAADLLRTLGKNQKALALLERGRSAFPDHWGIEFSVGQLHFNLYKQSNQPPHLNNCLKALRRARELNSGNYKVLFFLALTCTRASMYSEALSAVESILETSPSDRKALALTAHIERARAASAAASRRGEASEADLTPTAPQTGAGAQDPANKLLERVTDEVPETIAAFALNEEGSVIGGEVRDNALFDFSDCAAAVTSLAMTCKNDTDRIGIGTLQSCVLTGESWQVVIRAIDDMSLVAFLEGTTAAPSIESVSEQLVAQAS